MPEKIIAAMLVPIVAFCIVYFLTPILIRFLEKKNFSVKDIWKEGNVLVVRPGGPSIFAGIIISEIILYLMLPRPEILAIIATTTGAFIVGIIDDIHVMGGWFKPLALAISAIPIIFLGAYDSDLAFPVFGMVKIPILYLAIIIFMIPITGNTINSIDVINGAASGFMIIASTALMISLLILQNYDIAIASSSLIFVSVAFYIYHKLPSKIFPGDSGALTFGAMYGTIAIVGEVEIIAAVALLPAVVNSFLFLSSTKRIVEHRTIKSKPVTLTEDFKLKASKENGTPITLVRLILAVTGPMTEKNVCFSIFRLALFSATLAVISAFLMEVQL